MRKLLKTYFGYEKFRPLQKEVIDAIMMGEDTLVLMPTGGGKSLCYQLPALALPGLTLVVSPLIALMKDQVDALKTNGITADFLNSSLSAKKQKAVIARARAGETKLLYIAPERLGSFEFSNLLDELEVSLLAIDEAHCISEWGHDFRPDYRNLRSLQKKLPGVPTIALTATATPQVREDIVEQLGLGKAKRFVSSFNRENLHYHVRPKFDTFTQLTHLLEGHKGESAIVYCFSRKDTEQVAKKLSQAGFSARAYHAGLTSEVRVQVQNSFVRDEVPIIVATIAFGMGIDKPDVRLVVHMDLPKTIEGYYQETGRAGRDGLPSQCVLFYSYADRRKHEFFASQIQDAEERQLSLRKIDDVIDYAQTPVCRRTYLLIYFGEDYRSTTCDACDNCVVEKQELFDATEVAQKVLSTVVRTGQRFGIAHICDVLRGSEKKRVLELGHHNLSVHGIAKDLSAPTLREYIQSMKTYGYLEQNTGEYPTLRVGPKGKDVLLGKVNVLLPALRPTKKSRGGSSGTQEYHADVFNALRTLRKHIADEEHVPPFMIFGDKTLQEMARYLPSDMGELGDIFGVGAKKKDAFGAEFLDCIRVQVEEHGFKPLGTLS